MTALVRGGIFTVDAVANWGRWVAHCPICPSALAVQHGGLVTCRECGTDYEVAFPAFAVAVERLLLMRPDVTTRNWLPGETLHDLLAENVEHGIGPTEPGQEIAILDDCITLDTLPASTARRQIGA